MGHVATAVDKGRTLGVGLTPSASDAHAIWKSQQTSRAKRRK